MPCSDAVLEAIDELVEAGILGGEMVPDPNFWHWPVIRREDLPEWLESNYNIHGEIRLYWV